MNTGLDFVFINRNIFLHWIDPNNYVVRIGIDSFRTLSRWYIASVPPRYRKLFSSVFLAVAARRTVATSELYSCDVRAAKPWCRRCTAATSQAIFARWWCRSYSTKSQAIFGKEITYWATDATILPRYRHAIAAIKSSLVSWHTSQKSLVWYGS